MWMKFLMWFSPARVKLLISFITILVFFLICYNDPSCMVDLLLAKAHCVNSSDMIMSNASQCTIEATAPLDEQMSEVPNQPTIPHVLPGCSNRVAARLMGSLTGFLLGLASSIGLYVYSGIDLTPQACDLLDALKSASDSSTSR